MNVNRCQYFYANEYMYYQEVSAKISVLPESMVEFLKEEQVRVNALRKEELANLIKGNSNGPNSLSNYKNLDLNKVKKTAQVFLDPNVLIPNNLKSELNINKTPVVPPIPSPSPSPSPVENVSFSEPQTKMSMEDELNFVIGDNYNLQDQWECKKDAKSNWKPLIKPEILVTTNNLEDIKKGIINADLVENIIKSVGYIPDMPLFGKVLKYISQICYADYINYFNKYNSNYIHLNQSLEMLNEVDTKISNVYIYYKLAFIFFSLGLSLTSLSCILMYLKYTNIIYFTNFVSI